MTADQRPRDRLLRWYDAHHRKLPWRNAPGHRLANPYWVLVSEIMLQQTRVDVVVPRFEEFLKQFPTVESLATADKEVVRAQWSGLGYYRRAERLHQAAKAVVDLGGFPRTAQGLAALPGVGEYTSAAVASIAFGEPVPVLDGNVERVLTRFLTQAGNPKHRKVRRILHKQASRLVDPCRPGDSNQALMELGATVCRKGNPVCGECPLRAGCLAFQQGRATEFPTAQRKQQRRKQQWFQRVELRDGGAHDSSEQELLLVKRTDNAAVLGGAWLLPDARPGGRPEVNDTEPGEQERELAAAETLGRFKHSITTTEYEIVLVHESQCLLKEPDATQEHRWVALRDFDAKGRWSGADPLPTSSMLAKAIKALRRGGIARGAAS